MVAQSLKLAAGAVGLMVLLAGCGGGGGGGGGDSAPASSGGGSASAPAPAVPVAAALNVDFGLKQLRLSWAPVVGATSYRVFESVADGTFQQIGGDLPASQTSYNRDIAVHQQNWAAARYRVDACSSSGCSSSETVLAGDRVLKAIGYVKAGNTEAGDHFAWTLALSADGNTLAVGAPGESAAATNGADNNAGEAGAVYVFTRGDAGWGQQAYLKATSPQAGATFGESLALSSDGNTLVAGAPLENVSSSSDAGAAYVFLRTGATWGSPAQLKASAPAADAYFGWAAALNSDGTTLAISAVGTNSDTGTVYVFTRSAGASTWTQRSALAATNATTGDGFGTSLAINGAGSVLAIGAPYRASAGSEAGAAYVFSGGGASWTQTAYLKAANAGSGDNFGAAVALNGAGTALVVGAPYEASGAANDPANNSASKAGAVYVFNLGGGSWAQSAYLKASNAGTNDNFGQALALSAVGDFLVVGAIGESSAATGVAGNQSDNSLDGVGAAYTFRLANGSWSQDKYLKPATSKLGYEFGSTFGISADTRTLAIGATFEGSGFKGIGDDLGDQADTSAPEAGAVWLY